jgi:hypothetical protein
MTTIKPFDQFNKKLFQQILSPYGRVTPNRAVLGGERTIDILFEPDPDDLRRSGVIFPTTRSTIACLSSSCSMPRFSGKLKVLFQLKTFPALDSGRRGSGYSDSRI